MESIDEDTNLLDAYKEKIIEDAEEEAFLMMRIKENY